MRHIASGSHPSWDNHPISFIYHADVLMLLVAPEYKTVVVKNSQNCCPWDAASKP
jgi:hypothetical protein